MSLPAPFPSRTSLVGALAGVSMLAALSLPLPVAAVTASGTVVIQAGRVVEEDLFAAAGVRVVVDGRIEGDLTVVTRHLIINGVVEGDVNGLAWSVEVPGEVQGSVRVAAWDAEVGGSVGDDVMVLARSVGVDGSIGRDLLVAGVSARHSGSLGGELRGDLLWGLTVAGRVAEDVDVGIHRLTITDSASVGSAVRWRQGLIGQNIRGWTARTDISSTADVGLVSEVRPLPADLSVRAFRLLLQLLSFIAVLFSGVLLFYLFPRATERAIERAWFRPASSFGVGLALFAGVPVAVVIALFTVVLVPAGLVALALWVLALFVGAVPALIALGRRVTRNPEGLVGPFVAAAIGWRLLRIIPLAGYAIYLLVVIWGMGAWALGLWEGWKGTRTTRAPAPLTGAGPRLELLGLDVPVGGPPAAAGE